MFTCQTRGKTYKNSKSLRIHRYSYHRKRKSELEENRPNPPLKRIPTSPSVDSMSIHSNDEFNDNFDEFEIDDIQSRLIDVEMDTMQINIDIESLQSSVDGLKTLTKTLEKDTNDKFYLNKAYHPDNKTISTLGLKSAIQSNERDIAEIKEKLNTYNETDESGPDDDELEDKDLIDDLSEVRSLFSSHDYDNILGDIPKLRKVFNLMIQHIHFDQFDNGVINLLSSISKSSKSIATEIVRDNFTQFAQIFEQIKDEIDQFTDPRDKNVSGNDLSSDSDDNLDEKSPDVTDTAETDNYSITSSETEDHVDNESGSHDSEDYE